MKRGDIISWNQMVAIGEGFQQGMHFNVYGRDYAIVNMSVRPGAPFADRWEDNGNTIIYEGHDLPKGRLNPDPKMIDQPTGPLCENGRFIKAANKFKAGHLPQKVKVYEKIKSGIWVYNGYFLLTDYWQETDGNLTKRKVCKFKLEAIEENDTDNAIVVAESEHARLIPTAVKVEVYKRDKGCCRICGAKENLHYDHILPYSKGGTSTDAQNIQILCAKCNLKKGAKIL